MYKYLIVSFLVGIFSNTALATDMNYFKHSNPDTMLLADAHSHDMDHAEHADEEDDTEYDTEDHAQHEDEEDDVEYDE